jgi:hypothetical protein
VKFQTGTNPTLAYVGPPAGPGPDPAPGVVDPFNAWCGPTSASNLLGHWDDVYGVHVGDGIPFAMPCCPLPWPGPRDWHDMNLGSLRPPPGPVPTPDSDVGWFMDTNNSGSTLRANGAHVGTFTKDLHVGLAELLSDLAVTRPAIGSWSTGTQGAGIALGTNPSGGAAMPHPDAASAFAEIKAEVAAGRTVIVTWTHWNITSTGMLLSPVPSPDEAQFGGEYYTISTGSPGTADPWGNDEAWPESVSDPLLNLGHIVTAVGYILAGDPDDINAATNPTNWVIVHDNIGATARNVIVPLTNAEYGAHWIANTNAVQLPGVPALGATGRWLFLALIVGLMLLGAKVSLRTRSRRAST